MTIFTVFDTINKIAFKQFKTKEEQHEPDYNLKQSQAHTLQTQLQNLFDLPNDRIGVHINIFNDVPVKNILFN